MLKNVFYPIKMHFIDLFYLCLTSLWKISCNDLYNLSQTNLYSNYGNLQLLGFKNSRRKE